MNYEGTCQCDIGECGAQRDRMICELGCPYWEYSCKGLCQCLVQQGAWRTITAPLDGDYALELVNGGAVNTSVTLSLIHI